ncbi:HNH endonuclease signature motif containing protein [Psychroserpens sp. Hel_I_66]
MDHIIILSIGGRTDPSNMQLLIIKRHKGKTLTVSVSVF